MIEDSGKSTIYIMLSALAIAFNVLTHIWFHTHRLYLGFVSETFVDVGQTHIHTQDPWADAASDDIPEMIDN